MLRGSGDLREKKGEVISRESIGGPVLDPWGVAGHHVKIVMGACEEKAAHETAKYCVSR